MQATARRHVKREKLWWLENRIHTEVPSSHTSTSADTIVTIVFAAAVVVLFAAAAVVVFAAAAVVVAAFSV